MFRATDGRPATLPGWKVDAQIAAQLIAAVHAQTNDPVIDYEHQSTQIPANGQPAPGCGLVQTAGMAGWRWPVCVDARWTDRARAMIEAGEYRYLSPVFEFDGATGAVTRLQ